MRTEVRERLSHKVHKTDSCWVWTGYKTAKGYGQMSVLVDGVWRRRAPHKIAWELENGPVPKGLLVCHKCDNPPCVRVEHLFLGTPMDNTKDMISKGRNKKKLTYDQVLEIRRLYLNLGVKQSTLAAQFGVDQTQISHIVRGTQRRYA